MRIFLACFVLLCGLSGRAEAVSLRDLIDLSKQGISDDILIALIEAEKSVFHLGAGEVKALKAEGLSDRLVIHLLQTPSLRPAPEVQLHVIPQRSASREEAPPEVIVIERVETIAVPVYVPVRVARPDRREPDPAYWGYGGMLRPDAWGAAPQGQRAR